MSSQQNPAPEKWYHPKGHRIKFEILREPVVEYHTTLSAALKYRNQCLSVIMQIKCMFAKEQITGDLKSPLSHKDWNYVEGAIEGEIPTAISELIRWIDPNVIQNNNKANKIRVCDLMRWHVESKAKEGTPINQDNRSTFYYWIDKAKIRNVYCQDLNTETLLDERVRILAGYKGNGQGFRSVSLTSAMTSTLSMAWDRLCYKYPQEFPVNYPRQMPGLADNDVEHTPRYEDDEVHAMIKMAYAEDEIARPELNARGKRNPTAFLYLGPLIELFSQTGIRNHFLTTLHRNECIMNVKHPYIDKRMKRKREVGIPLSEIAIDIILKRLDDPECEASGGYLFPLRWRTGKKAGQIGVVKEWSNRFVKLLKKHGMRVTPMPVHSFRSYTATRLRDMGMHTVDIADMLGIDERSVKVYIRGTNKQVGNIADKLNEANDERDKPPK